MPVAENVIVSLPEFVVMFIPEPATNVNVSDVLSGAILSCPATAKTENWLPLRIDFIYADQEAFAVVEANVGADRCSDHRLVKAGLKWAD